MFITLEIDESMPTTSDLGIHVFKNTPIFPYIKGIIIPNQFMPHAHTPPCIDDHELMSDYAPPRIDMKLTTFKYKSKKDKIRILTETIGTDLPDNISSYTNEQLKVFADEHNSWFQKNNASMSIKERKLQSADSNTLATRDSSTRRSFCGSMANMYTLNPSQIHKRNHFTQRLMKHLGIPENNDFFTNQPIEGKTSCTLDHAHPLVKNKQWTGQHPADPFNLILTKSETNRDKGNKDPKSVLKTNLENGVLTEHEYSQRIAYLEAIEPYMWQIGGDELNQKNELCGVLMRFINSSTHYHYTKNE